MQDFKYLKNVVSLRLDAGKCTGCGLCLEVCPHAVLAMNGKSVQIRYRDACMECGACSRNCPVAAVSVDAGVGCAAAVINGMLGREGGECCCSVDPKKSSGPIGGCCS